MGIDKITMLDLDFYKMYDEWFYYVFYKEKENITYHHNLEIFDVVRVKSQLEHDTGYAGQIGIVCGLSVSNQVYVYAYSPRAKEHRVCGFSESELIKVNKDMYSFKDLYLGLKDYLLRNKFNLSTAAFEEAWLKYRKGEKFEDIVGYVPPRKKSINNVINFDFKNKRRL